MIHADNPILKQDFPDVDAIRVGDTYYMASTTMYFMPGCVILRSYDLANWEFAAYVYETLEDNPAHNMEGDKNIYGLGMWAPCLRFHNDTYYVCFASHDTKKTYLFTSKDIEGPWNKGEIEGFYHDASLLFDDDKIYIAYGNTTIYLTELKSDLSGPQPDGLHRVVIKDEEGVPLGYEGCHIYRIFNKYYLFCIHAPEKGKFFRTQACFSADSLESDFIGGDILKDDMGYMGQGVAQGGIVDTPDGDWYLILFQDSGAVGRIPVLLPVIFENGFPSAGINGKVPKHFSVKSTRPDYIYTPLQSSDDFEYERNNDGVIVLKNCWQWNHNPHNSLWSVTDGKGELRLKTDKLCMNLCQARNVLTQRTTYPVCSAQVIVNGTGLDEGDFAGIAVLQSNYAAIALTVRNGRYEVVMFGKPKPSIENSGMFLSGNRNDTEVPSEYERIPVNGSEVRLKITCDFTRMKDEAEFYLFDGGAWRKIGITHKLYFWLDHFTGARFALFGYSTEKIGGTAQFANFIYETGDAGLRCY